MSDDAVIRAVRTTARLTVYWRKKQISVLGGAILLVARQTGVQPMAVLREVMKWLDDWLEKNGKDAELR